MLLLIVLSSIPAHALVCSSKLLQLSKSLSLEAALQMCNGLCVLLELHSLVHWLCVVVILVHLVLGEEVGPGTGCELTHPGGLVYGNVGLFVVLNGPHVGDIRRVWRQHRGKLG